MADEEADGFNLDDRDRLPWLEPAEPMDSYESVPLQKVVALVLLGLALLGLIVGGGWWLKSRGERASRNEVTLIAAPGGAYKIPATDPKAKEFKGEGDQSYEASAGAESNGKIDASKAPETPMTDIVPAQPAPKPSPKPKPKASGEAKAPIKDETRARAPAAGGAIHVAEEASAGGIRVQLGAYNSDAIAQEAWKRLVARFEELSGAAHSVEPVTTKGRTLYRLRMNSGDAGAASQLCGKLRVAGESCWVVP